MLHIPVWPGMLVVRPYPHISIGINIACPLRIIDNFRVAPLVWGHIAALPFGW
jgi:hypothetical protein